MTRYERRVLAVNDGVVDVAGRIVHVLEAPRKGRNQITALVETAAASAAAGDDTEGVDGPVPSKAAGATTGPITCAGTRSDDSPCTREVDLHGDYCWQHEEDNE